ncbi:MULTISPECIES: AAA family ATPase [Bacteroidaceae]|jgi:ATPase associated with various cellular activities AAA_5|uniref:AAA family ATPase n=1 Tax=Bacteroidaceae TaxID=815 RepID=UPI0021A73F65|nr:MULTISPECIES: AAA family ATPase [Bacteroidaceae]MDC2302896.1 AAA family ATPase [Bacteroides stercoris]UYV07409.1 AAA family ATPase [Phocaeicola dorei]
MKDLFSFLNNASDTSDFKAKLSERGGFITFSNSGRRGGIKFFQIGLDNILQTLKDILNHIEVFKNLTKYEETPWRNNGSEYFTDPVANANSTVQTKPLFSTLSKVVMWANQPKLDDIDSDAEICLDKEAIEMTIAKLEDVADSFKPFKKSLNIADDNSRQQIYYGAPGTGKSHRIKEQLEGVPKGNIFRITFHPDSDYSTFVGAYKPTMEKDCECLYGKDELISKLTELKEQGVTYSPQKFGAKYWYSLKQLTLADKRDILLACGMSDNYTVEFDKGIAVGEELLKGTKKSRIVYNFIPQTFLNAYMQAYRKPNENVYLIIEEINRGNCAQIFGDLFQLLDRDEYGVSEYTIKADADLKAFLVDEMGKDSDAIKDGELCLPSNLYIYATMNTSDQSLFPIDSAFKRRWDWEYEPIKYKNTNWVIDIQGKTYSWVSFQKEINRRIFEATSSEDKMLGDYFVNPSDGIITEKMLLNKILFYLWNDVCKDGEGDIFKVSDTEDVSFSELYGDGGKQKLMDMMDYLHVEKLGVEVQSESDIQTDDASRSTKHKKLVAVILDGIRYEPSPTKFDLYLNVINKIGIDKVAPIVEQSKYGRRDGCPLISDRKYEGIENSKDFSYVQVGNFYVVKGLIDDTTINILELIKSKLQLDLQIIID